MTTRMHEIRNVAIQTATMAGASCNVGLTRGGHQVAILSLNGRTRKVFFSTSPSDRRALMHVRSNVRHALRLLEAIV